jgi:hypothetical protein
MKPLTSFVLYTLFVSLPLSAQVDSTPFVPATETAVPGESGPPVTTHGIVDTPESPGASRENAAPKVDSAVTWPELIIRTGTKQYPRAKILCITVDSMMFLEYPYWNVKPLTIAIDDLTSLRKGNRLPHCATWGAAGFGIAFLAAGIAFLPGCRYDEDYRFALPVSTILGILSGIFGFTVGISIDIIANNTRPLLLETQEEKTIKVMRFMGLLNNE